jgi:hypothetical protein
MPISSKILEEPIDWTRDESLQEVPTAASINENIRVRWHRINTIIFDGDPVEFEIRAIDEALLRHKNLIASGTLDSRYDWKFDFELARWSHGWYLDALDRLKNTRTTYIEFWQTWAKDGTEFFRKLSLEGMKLIFLLHGAIALGGLGILTQASGKPSQLVMVAKLAVCFSAFGILAAGMSQLAMLHFGLLLIGRIQGKLTGNVRWAKVRAARHAMSGALGGYRDTANTVFTSRYSGLLFTFASF